MACFGTFCPPRQQQQQRAKLYCLVLTKRPSKGRSIVPFGARLQLCLSLSQIVALFCQFPSFVGVLGEDCSLSLLPLGRPQRAMIVFFLQIIQIMQQCFLIRRNLLILSDRNMNGKQWGEFEFPSFDLNFPVCFFYYPSLAKNNTDLFFSCYLHFQFIHMNVIIFQSTYYLQFFPFQ